MITLGLHAGIHVLRDDLLTGGTKSRFIESLLDPGRSCYVYASPVYGGFQIALAAVARRLGKQAAIFSAKRNVPHANSLRAKAEGARVFQVPHGYLSHCQARAKAYAAENDGQYLEFGANYPEAIAAIAGVMREVSASLGAEPDTVFCAVGSGTLIKGIIAGTDRAQIRGVQVGADYSEPTPPRVTITPYGRPFAAEARIKPPFPSCANYDAKAWEVCVRSGMQGNTLFWNVLG